MQSARRAGRTRPGHFYDLYPYHIFQSMNHRTVLQIQASDFTNMEMKMVVQNRDPFRFPWLHKPPNEQIFSAFDTLEYYDCTHNSISLFGSSEWNKVGSSHRHPTPSDKDQWFESWDLEKHTTYDIKHRLPSLVHKHQIQVQPLLNVCPTATSKAQFISTLALEFGVANLVHTALLQQASIEVADGHSSDEQIISLIATPQPSPLTHHFAQLAIPQLLEGASRVRIPPCVPYWACLIFWGKKMFCF